MSHHILRTVPVALCVAAVLPPFALATSIDPGFDLFRTEPGTYFDFSVQPIPADFFGPGSDPFDGIIDFTGHPMPSPLCPGDPPHDTMVSRAAPAFPPETIPIELVQLSLVSINPIRVTYPSGADELWDVDVRSFWGSSPPGSMTIRHEFPSGGTFDSQLPVRPIFTFTRVGSTDTRTLDPGPIPFSATDVPWWHVDPPPNSCTSNFCVSPLAPVVFWSPFGQHVVSGICPWAATATPEGRETRTWGRAKAAYR